MHDLRQRVPGHSLIDLLLHQWEAGTIRLDADTNDVVVGEDAVGWYRGVIGERRVGSILEMLSDDHTVLHSVPVGKGTTDIDHLVIGRAGVFSINTKYSPGKKVWSAGYGLLVDGHKTHYVRNSVKEAHRASQLLSVESGLTVPVTALIVFVSPGTMTRKAPAAGGQHDPEVRVLADHNLLRVIMNRPVFSDEQVARIATAAVRPQTWHRAPTESTIGHHITREFEALEDAVGPRLAGEYSEARQNVSVSEMSAPLAQDRIGRGEAGPAPTRIRMRPAVSRSTPSRSTPSRATPSRPTPARPTPARPSSSRRRQTSLEMLLGGLLVPAASLIGLWIYLSVLSGT